MFYDILTENKLFTFYLINSFLQLFTKRAEINIKSRQKSGGIDKIIVNIVQLTHL